MAYASSQHLANIEDYIPDVLAAKEQGYKGYKIHPGGGQPKERPADSRLYRPHRGDQDHPQSRGRRFRSGARSGAAL